MLLKVVVFLCTWSIAMCNAHFAKNLHLRQDLIRGSRSSKSAMHQVMLSIQQRNVDKLHDLLMEVSSPGPKYGQYLSRKEVADLTANPTATSRVKEYLSIRYGNDVTISEVSLYGEYIIATGPISVWEDLLNTQFYEFQQRHVSNQQVIGSMFHRADSYAIPPELQSDLDAVFEVIDFPTTATAYQKHSYRTSANSAKRSKPKSNIPTTESTYPWVDIDFLNQYYYIDSNTGSSSVTQYVYGALQQYYSVTDLLTFEREEISPSYSQIPIDIGGDELIGPCSSDSGMCDEANLDVQFMMGTSQVTPTTFYYTDLGFLGFLYQFANSSNAYGSVISFSYAELEQFVSAAVMKNYNTEAQKLGLQGCTLVCSSGDDGAIGYIARLNPAYCGYQPFFPGVSPYMTVVGGTMGGPNGLPEVACQADIFPDGYEPIITTGGGFSYLNNAPSYQQSFIATYLQSEQGKSSFRGYPVNGRGYPDVSLVSMLYEVYFNGTASPTSGTSASTPTFAAFLSLINAARNESSMPPLGFVNPMLYTYFDSFILNDITSGNNHCGAFAYTCCEEGFTAAEGWDPLTGLGSVNFTAMKHVFLDPAKLYSTSATIMPPDVDFAYANTNISTPTPQPSRAAGWVTFTIFDQDTCDASSDVVSVQAFQTDECFQRFNLSGNPMGSYRYACAESVDSSNPQVIISYYEDTKCNIPSSDPDILSVGGCSLFGNQSYSPQLYTSLYNGYLSAQVLCNVSSAATPSLPNENFVTIQQFNAHQCVHMTSYFAYKDGYCFSTGVLQDASYKYVWPYLYEYLDYKCSQDELNSTTYLEGTCTNNVVNYDDGFPLDFSMASQQYVYVAAAVTDDISTDDMLPSGAIVGIILGSLAGLVLIVALIQYLRPSLFEGNASGHASNKALRKDGYSKFDSTHGL